MKTAKHASITLAGRKVEYASFAQKPPGNSGSASDQTVWKCCNQRSAKTGM